MANQQLRFDPYLQGLRADELRQMARLWVDRPPMRKNDCIALITAGLVDRASVCTAVAKLQPFERAALALARRHGGFIEANALRAELQMTGLALPDEQAHNPFIGYTNHALIQRLIRSGLFLAVSDRDHTFYTATFYTRQVLFSDERLMAAVDGIECRSIEIQPVEPPLQLLRRPQTVLMDLIGFAQAVAGLGAISLTKAGAPRVSDLRKIARALNWADTWTDQAELPFARPTLALVTMFAGAGLLRREGDRLVPNADVTELASRDFGDLVRALLDGLVATQRWNEWLDWQMRESYGSAERLVQARTLLLIALTTLPVEDRRFMSFDAFEAAMYARVGEVFSLSHVPNRPYLGGRNEAENMARLARWQEQRRNDWLRRDRPWLQLALGSWAYFLGLVELGTTRDQVVGLRLTDLGHAILHPATAAAPALTADEGQGAWVVQPTFEVLVYLDRAVPAQLAFLEAHAERMQTQAHTALYKLTRDTVYHGLERGTSLDTLLEHLVAGAATEVPQNVLTEIRGWAGLRERITLRRRAHVLEFADVTERDAALAHGLSGAAVGERYVLTNGTATQPVKRRIDYHAPLPACLTISEQGVIEVTAAVHDLALTRQLGRWAEQQAAGRWQLTAQSVAAAVCASASVNELFQVLHERLATPLPPLLAVALRAWAGAAPQVNLAQATLLHCPDLHVLEALEATQHLQPYLRGRLGPELLLVETSGLEELRAWLAWAGLEVGTAILLR